MEKCKKVSSFRSRFFPFGRGVGVRLALAALCWFAFVRCGVRGP
uniref:Uncharacterized protein n=1 Tax=Anguilla anguilla TaxID=7936 RepID=A0A0E9RB83_ANGAN